MLTPKRTKYRKVQKGILKGKAQRGIQEVQQGIPRAEKVPKYGTGAQGA